MDLNIYHVAFAPAKTGDQPIVKQYVALTLVDVMNYVKSSDGNVIGIQEIGPCVLCGSFVDFE